MTFQHMNIDTLDEMKITLKKEEEERKDRMERRRIILGIFLSSRRKSRPSGQGDKVIVDFHLSPPDAHGNAPTRHPNTVKTHEPAVGKTIASIHDTARDFCCTKYKQNSKEGLPPSIAWLLRPCHWKEQCLTRHGHPGRVSPHPSHPSCHHGFLLVALAKPQLAAPWGTRWGVVKLPSTS